MCGCSLTRKGTRKGTPPFSSPQVPSRSTTSENSSGPSFAKLPHVEKIKIFAWWIHTHGQRERFDVAAVRSCYNSLHLPPSANIASELNRLSGKKPAELLKDAGGYRLAGQVRTLLDERYGDHETVLVVSQLLRNLPGKVSDEGERRFLSEALTCYKHQAFRAAIVMTWNLAYDHLLEWTLADPQRLASFNAAIQRKYPKKVGLVIGRREDFEDLREFEVVEVCGTAGLVSSNLKKILNDKLSRRNMAAHPSQVEITRAQADDAITDLVNNVVLKLT